MSIGEEGDCNQMPYFKEGSRVSVIQILRVNWERVRKMGKISGAYGPFPVGIYLFKVNNKSTRTKCEICSKLTIKTPERRQWRRSGVLFVNFEHISHLALVFLLLTLNS